MNDKQFLEMNNKLDTVVKLLAAQIIDDKEYREQVNLLSKVGISAKDIAILTGKTINNVNVTLHLIKKRMEVRKNDRKIIDRNRC